MPTEKFYAEHGGIRAAGLVYPKASNLFVVKYFAVESMEVKLDGNVLSFEMDGMKLELKK